MKKLREYIAEADKQKKAIGHFNISNLEMLRAIFNSAKLLNVPVIIGTSEGERDFIGQKQAVAVVKSLQEEHNFPIFINADHTYSLEKAKEAVEAGYDMIIFDKAEASNIENIKEVKEFVEYCGKINPEIVVEGELGFIGKNSKILDDVPEGVKTDEDSLTKPEDALDFVSKTGVYALAPAVGNIHGMLKIGHDPKLNIGRIAEIRKICGAPLVLHGGSGNSNEEFKEAIKAGISVIHINTEIRVAYRKSLELSLQEDLEEMTPYKYLKAPIKAVEKLVEEKLKVFNNIN
jgi:fructose-bisphosphate aldolase class II